MRLNPNEFSPFQATTKPLWHLVARTLSLPHERRSEAVDPAGGSIEVRAI